MQISSGEEVDDNYFAIEVSAGDVDDDGYVVDGGEAVADGRGEHAREEQIQEWQLSMN